jgi:hypothetical protein
MYSSELKAVACASAPALYGGSGGAVITRPALSRTLLEGVAVIVGGVRATR